MTAAENFTGTAVACVRGERPVFAGLDFTIASGGALVLTGANGSGKSSLLRLMAGLLPAADGHLTWNGIAVAEEPDIHRQRTAYLGHLSATKALLTPLEDVAFWLSYRAPGLNRGAVTARAQESLAWAGISALGDMPCRFLSAGQRQRLALARLAAHPTAKLWLLDEPTTGLDSAALAALTERMAGHRARGGMVIAATHQALDLPGAASLDLGIFARRRGQAGLDVEPLGAML